MTSPVTSEDPGSSSRTPARSFSHIELSYVAAFYFNQDNTSTLTDLLRKYNSYSPELLDHVQFVLIDDASPSEIKIPDDINLNLLMLKIDKDIPWNQPGARNLGMIYARSDKAILTDLDHEFPETTLRALIKRNNPVRNIYKMKRIASDASPCRPHPNTFLLSRSRFLRLYGYDEEFCGNYGFDDAMFWRWQRYHGTRFLYLPDNCHVVARQTDLTKDHSLERDLSPNRVLANRKKQEWKQYGPNSGHSRLFLNFSWTVKMDRARETHIPKPAPNRWWIYTWLWRWLMPAG